MFALLATFTIAAAAFFQAQAALPLNCDRNVTVAAGDTCDAISAKHNASTYQLASVNTNIDRNCSNLYVGEVLCLGLTGKDCNTTYVAVSGDTCAGITAAFNISESTLFTNNPNLNTVCTNLYPNEVLCVSGTIYVNLPQRACTL